MTQIIFFTIAAMLAIIAILFNIKTIRISLNVTNHIPSIVLGVTLMAVNLLCLGYWIIKILEVI